MIEKLVKLLKQYAVIGKAYLAWPWHLPTPNERHIRLQAPVKRPVLDGLAYVVGPDRVFAFEVCDGAGKF